MVRYFPVGAFSPGHPAAAKKQGVEPAAESAGEALVVGDRDDGAALRLQHAGRLPNESVRVGKVVE